MTRSFSGSGLADRTAESCFQAGHAGSIPVARSNEKHSSATVGRSPNSSGQLGRNR